MINKVTKNQKARMIIQALYVMPRLPEKDHFHVKILEKKTVKELDGMLDYAINIGPMKNKD